MTDEIPGYDIAAVERWVGDHVESLEPPFEWTKLEGGHSNLTYRIESRTSSRAAVIRRPPLGELLPKAHDMAREWACISALWPTPVPVAEPLAFCEGPEITGAHFYVMGLVEGRALYTRADVEDWVDPSQRTTMAHSWIDTLAELHALDPDEIGLGDLGRKEGYVARQTATWYRSWTASVEAAAIDDPVIHQLHELLTTTAPQQARATVVHGDYGTHNVLIGAHGRVEAVVDWEIATLGDPMADFAYSLNAWVEPGDPLLDSDDAPTLAPGFPKRSDLIERYAARTGCDLSDLDFYAAFNRFKTACILHGVYARYRRGQKAISEEELGELEQRVRNAVERARLARESLN